MQKPSVFVSSTCYDLKQVRADMFQFLDGLGFEPVLSEYNSFPIQPEANTIENCLVVVNAKADIFVLIIGGRYGSATDDGRSVTNREYLSARAKGIPVYVFVQRSVLDLLRIWKANQSGDFSSAVDSPKVFEFVSELHEGGDNWIIPFDTAQDIFAALKVQLAYLFRDSLQLRLRASQLGVLSRRFRHLEGKELRLLIERPKGWEYLLLGAALRREFEAMDDVKRDWQYGIALGSTFSLKPSEFFKWSREKSDEAQRIGTNLASIMNDAASVALGPPGVSGDPDAILYVANRFASVYRSALQWKIDFLRVALPAEFDKVKALAATFCDNLVREVEEYQSTFETRIEDALQSIVPGQTQVLHLKLTLTSVDITPFTEELARLADLVGSGAIKWE
jgi:predicted component of type VI protein secretion system